MQGTRPTLPWNRFWVPLGGPIHCGEEGGGFLTDPEGEYGTYGNPHISRLRDLLPASGPIVLCGEPGIGKSTELANVKPVIEAQAAADGGQCYWTIFREVADISDFRRSTVESESWQEWRAGSSHLTLVVDGVDEGLLRVPNFLNDLTALLKNEPLNRLRLVLACRTAEWPIETGRRLLALWPPATPAPLYELCPLRLKDAQDAARALDCDPDAFLRAIWERGAVALASRPVTLFFLLSEFRRHGGLPATHRELYERGTANLAREVDPARLELLRAMRKTAAHITNTIRLHAAQRLATVLLLTGRSAVVVSTDASVHDPRDLPLEAAATDGLSFVGVPALEEALESALFTSLGPRRFGFVHQTFAECLAAQHLAPLPTVQLRRLLCQRDMRGEHVIPQLTELAAWLAGMHSGFCEHLLNIEPEVLLRSDVTRLQGAFKSRLVTALLRGATDEKIFDGRGFERFFDGLKHPGLIDQLRPIIADCNAGYIARRIAFAIASHCRLSELTCDLLDVIRNPSEPQHLRERAAYALEHVVPDERLEELEPLARGGVGGDPDDAIKGCALRRLVPAQWKIRDTLPFLTSPRNQHLIGAYHIFLEFEAPKLLEDSDVVPVLDWLVAHTGCFNSLHPTSKLALRAVARAVELIQRESFADALVRLWHSIAPKNMTYAVLNDEGVASAFAGNPVARRGFVRAFLQHPQVRPHNIYDLRYEIKFLVDADDLGWLLDELPSAASKHRVAWVKAIATLARDPEITARTWDKLLQRIAEVPELATEFAYLRAWDIDSPDSRTAKAQWLQEQRRERELARYAKQWEPPDLRPMINQALEAARADEYDAWLHLWYHLSRACERGRERSWSANVMEYPAWVYLTPGQRQLCRRAARLFLLRNADRAARYTSDCSGAFAGAAALWLCLDEVDRDPALRTVLAGPWMNVLAHQFSSDDGPRQQIFALLYKLNAPGATRVMLADAAEHARSHRHVSAFRNARHCWDPALSTAAESFLDSLVDPKSIVSGIEELLARDKNAGEQYALKYLRRCAPISDAYPVGLFSALISALQVAPLQALPIAEPILANDPTLARSVWMSVCYNMDVGRGNLLAQFDEQRLADLYLELISLFPKDDDPPEPGGTVTPRMTVTRIRDSIPGIIAARATEAGCRELLRLAALLPKQATWLRWTFRDAVTNIRRSLWRPPTPETVRLMLGRAGARMLTDDDDLLELVLESLARLQTRLTGQALPAAEELWLWEGGGLNRKKFRPKDEEALSDYIARWLIEDIGLRAGVVVNREVQPRRGARTDVVVEAVVPGSQADFDKLTVVIEVKGCWHDAVRTGLRSQLVDGYLREHGWRCGIYLVGWFVCPQWQSHGNRLLSDTANEAVSELAHLAAEFDGVASEFRVAPCLLDCTLPPMKAPST